MPLKKSSAPSSLGSSSRGPASLIKEVAALEAQLVSTERGFNPNPLIPLLALAREENPEVVHKAIWALYRVFVKYITAGKVRYHGGLGSRTNQQDRSEDALKVSHASEVADEDADDGSEGQEAKVVRRWCNERFEEYLQILGGSLRDAEISLRKSASLILLSFLPPLSAALTEIEDASPALHIPYLRTMLRLLVTGTLSLRGSKPTKQATISADAEASEHIRAVSATFKIDPKVQYAKSDASVLPPDVTKEIVDKLAAFDDIRWGFFHEIAQILSTIAATSAPPPAHLASNILSLVLPLNNLPREAEDINEFYCSHISKRPTKLFGMPSEPKKAKKSGNKGKAAVASNGLDWMAEFESESEDDEEVSSTGVAGKKRKRVGKANAMHLKIWSVDSHRREFTDMWTGILGLPLTKEETRSILLVLHSAIFPNMMRGKVIRLTDWLGSLCDQGGPLALLSLNGLFILIRDYNLDYPKFYRRLYTLMDREVMHVKYRARFFRLSEIFLASSLLPAALIASFVKKLARLALTAPPAAIIMIIPFVYNLLKRHPGCMIMLQREPEDAPGPDEPDAYNDKEEDPMQTGAIDSSLWELRALQKHYLSHVATMAKIFSEVFTKPEFLMEDFLDHGYASLFETEVKRRLKNPPALSTDIDKPITLLPLSTSQSENDLVADEQDASRVVDRLFVF